ncbi:MAG: LPXTG cell wall anchor domain-containing protein, partial [Acidaminococcaceae bacterium]
FFAKVLEGYLTCDASPVNGYMAFNLIDTNFLPRVASVWNMEGDLAGNLIKDFLSETDYATGTRETVAATDAFAKYQMMQNLYIATNNPTQNIGYFDNKSSLPLIIGIALVGLTSLAGLYILKKKRA